LVPVGISGLGGGGGKDSWVDYQQEPNKMTKEVMMEDLVKRSADSSGSAAAAGGDNSKSGDPIWRETGLGFNFELGSWTMILILTVGVHS